jgi:prevent-host-death family protein
MSVVSPEGAIGVYDLKNNLSAVLEEVLSGKEVTVTKHGRPIARIAPVTAPGPEERAQAVAAIHALGSRVRRLANELSAREIIDEGRRP